MYDGSQISPRKFGNAHLLTTEKSPTLPFGHPTVRESAVDLDVQGFEKDESLLKDIGSPQ